MGPADDDRDGGGEKFCAGKTSNRKRWPRFEFRNCSAIWKRGPRRISHSARESRRPSRAIARRARERRPLRCEDQLRIELGVVNGAVPSAAADFLIRLQLSDRLPLVWPSRARDWPATQSG